MSIVLDMLVKKQEIESRVSGFFKTVNLVKILCTAGAYKAKGVPVIQIMLYLVSLVFTKKSMYMALVLETLHASLHECIFLSDSEISLIIDSFIDGITATFKDFLRSIIQYLFHLEKY